MRLNRSIAAIFALLATSAPAAAQDALTAQTVDQLLGATAALPQPEAAPAPPLAWQPPPLPPWLAGQPYRQQPLFATVPVGGTVGGQVRGPISSSP